MLMCLGMGYVAVTLPQPFVVTLHLKINVSL